MSVINSFKTRTNNSEDTFELAKSLGAKCRGGELFLLVSDLGGGKTTFTKGLLSGLGSDAVVSSPTFTVNNVYDCPNGIYVHHFDFYRLNEGGVVAQELAEVLDDPKSIVVVEWGDIVSEVLPESKIEVRFDRSKEGEDVRQIDIKTSTNFSYLLEGLK